MDEFIEKVRQEMKRQDISMSQLARDVQVGRPYLHRVLAGEHTPSLEWAERVADYLGFTVTIGCR